MNTEQKDNELWQIAKKRADFKKHLLAYMLVNGFLVTLWFFTHDNYPGKTQNFWPKWVLFGWGIGLLFSYIDAYYKNSLISTEKEYEKLKNKH